MSKGSEAVKRWRERTKARLVEAMGGECVCCGYKRCHRALEFHHKDTNEKEIGIGGLRATVRSWDKIVMEARKCVVVCGNCHAEIHDGILTVPSDACCFDEGYANYRADGEMNDCPECGEQKPIDRITCSAACGRKRSWSVEWGKIDLPTMLANKTVQEVADELGVSNGAVRKRMKKLGIVPA